MRKQLLIFPLALALDLCLGGGALALTANPDTGPGCGLGKLLWGGYKHQKNIAPQVMMWTTNGIGMASFAISSGTSGCTNDGTIMAEQKVNVFVAATVDSLSQEMAQGRGEHLASLATLMGVPTEQHTAFFSLVQERYGVLIQAGEASPTALIRALSDAMTKDPLLVRTVAR